MDTLKKSNVRRSFPGRRIIVLSLMTVVVASGAWFWLRMPPSQNEIRHILLISIDTCRADYLSCYGYPRDTTPNIDALAKEGILFENVISPVPLTLPAHSSILTGTIPVYHGIHDNLGYRLGQSQVTLAEILRGVGFATGAVVSSYVLDSQFGLDQGFDSYSDNFEEPQMAIDIIERRGDETSRFANEWLEIHKDEKFFLFVHYFDPHADYDPPEPFATKFADSPYAGEIAFTDNCIGQVIDKLKELGLYDSTLIIITGDHGEMLGEHGEAEHGYLVYQSAIKVPLIFKLPGETQSRKIESLVGVIDIVATICSIIDIEAPKHIQGSDLSGFFRNRDAGPQDRHFYCESLMPTKYNANPLLSVVTDQYQYIQTTRPELYDLRQNPDETNNLARRQPQRVRFFQDKLRHIMEDSAGMDAFDSSQEMNAQSLERLKSLGYVGGRVAENFNLDQSRPDPKDLIDLHASNSKAGRLITEADYQQAENLCQEMLLRYPQFYKTHLHLAKIAMEQQDFAGAVPHLTEVLVHDPGGFEANNHMGMVLSQLGQFDKAITYYTKAMQSDPDNPVVLNNLATAFIGQGKTNQAISAFEKALEIYPEYAEAGMNLLRLLIMNDRVPAAVKHVDHMIATAPKKRLQLYNDFGGLLLQHQKLDVALIYFDKAIQSFPNEPQAYFHRGNVLLQQGKLEQGIKHFENMKQRWPQDARIYHNLGVLLVKMEKHRPAAVQFEKALQLDPEYKLARLHLAAALSGQGKLDAAVRHLQMLLALNPNQLLVHNELALIFIKQKKPQNALEHYNESLRLKADQPEVLYNLAKLNKEHGNLTRAVEYWQRALELRNDWIAVLNSLAWVKATSPDEKLHRPQEAVKLALRACELTDFTNAALLDTLSVAYGATGQFPEAVETAEIALQLAKKAGREDAEKEINKHLDLFKNRKAYRESKQ